MKNLPKVLFVALSLLSPITVQSSIQNTAECSIDNLESCEHNPLIDYSYKNLIH